MSFAEIRDSVPQLKPEERLALVELITQLDDKAKMTARPSLRNIRPSSVGAALRPFPAPDDDLLDEMLAAQ